MIMTWWRNWRRRRILARPFPAEWEALLQRFVWHYPRLSDDERQKLRQLVQVFVNEKYWEGCKGLLVDDAMRVTIAGHACLLTLGFGGLFLDEPQTVLIYPDQYVAEGKTHLPGGVVTETLGVRLGEAWQRGPVILSWSSIQRDVAHPHDGHNVVLHEFAHVLDMLNFHVDGTPPLKDSGEYSNWNDVMVAEYHRLIDDTQRGRATLLDEYGATSPVEFFAVATECFFEQPLLLQNRHARLYNLLRDFYRQDTAARMSGPLPV